MKSNQENWTSLLTLINKASSNEQLNDLFDLFLTIEEKEMLLSRYLIVQALFDQTLTQREIAEHYQVSISQITRGSNALKIINKTSKNFLTAHFKQL